MKKKLINNLSIIDNNFFEKTDKYIRFDKINGYHPWQDKVKDGYILYKARKLDNVKLSYFNFALAKQMGLIPYDHPAQMNPFLEKKILDTFSLQIVNEYDQLTNKRLKNNEIKPNFYMATRYLQLQHKSKIGKTSGDGRSIWNGFLQHKNKIWDISSRGTGVTCLSPGYNDANKPLKTGSNEVGYGCGLAEIDELYASLIMSEIFYNEDYYTERMLTIIDLGDGYGIGVRAAENLFRPAHLFLFLKQKKWEPLKITIDFIISRMKINKKYKIREKFKYDDFLQLIIKKMAKFIARLERNYIFTWIEWDGDNLLIPDGIIDYGSIRKFGLRHDKYRYDDVDRFSTTLNEQKNKAKYLIQTYIQMIHFLKYKKKKNIKSFAKSNYLKKFEKIWQKEILREFLFQIGFNNKQQKILLKNHLGKVNNLYKIFLYFEKKKNTNKLKKVADGINCSPIYNMKNFLVYYPYFLFENYSFFSSIQISFKELLFIILAKKVKKKNFSYKEKKLVADLQKSYKNLLKCLKLNKKQLYNLSLRSKMINSSAILTGNALINVVDEILNHRKDISDDEMQKIIDQFILEFSKFSYKRKDTLRKDNSLFLVNEKKLNQIKKRKEFCSALFKIVEEFKEDI